MKTEEEINQELIEIENKIRDRDTIFDSELIYFFKRWQKRSGKYSDVKLYELEFEDVFLSDKEYFVLTMGQSPKSYELNENNKGIAFYQGKTYFGDIYLKEPKVFTTNPKKKAKKDDILISLRAPAGVVNIANLDIAIGRGLASIRPKYDKVYNLYLFCYFKQLEVKINYENNKGGFFSSMDKGYLENLKILIPKPYKTYSSLDIQKMLVEFLEDNKTISDKERRLINNVDKDLQTFEKLLIPTILEQEDEYIRKMWIKWNSDPVEPRIQEDMVDFKLEDIEFEVKNLFQVVKLSNGSEFPKNYVKREEVQGDIPLISAGAKKDIMGYIKSLKGNKKDEPNEHYVFNDTKNKWNKVSHYIGKDYYTLTADGIGGTLIIRKKEDYPNGFYTTNVCKTIKFIDKNVNERYFYYIYTNAKKRIIFDFIQKANNENLKKINLEIPKPIKTKTKEYSSYEVQEAIVSFIDRFYRYKTNLENIMKNMRDLLDDIDRAFLYKTFKGKE